ncbi:hypothetical protein HanIR_Chr14g0708761 [Helianthus annuus]|nr:hypothetical protein HanIR_Chr14g0708761 [Helianthus annuus]
MMNNDLYTTTKYKDKLEPSYKFYATCMRLNDSTGKIHEVFMVILRGLSGIKLTRPGKFRSCQDSYAIKSSLKAEE